MYHLNNTLVYEMLQDDPTERFSSEITSVLARMTEREILDRDVCFPPTKKCQDILVLYPTIQGVCHVP